MECLDANTVQDLMSGALDSTARGAVLGHLDACDDCRELLGATARHELVEPITPRMAIVESTMDAVPGMLDATAVDSVAALSPPAASGSVYGRYELDERIGAGAMGVVWRAHDPKLGRRVALKLLRRRDALLTERLVREAQAMAQVNHPNVVAVYDVGTSAGSTYIAMELVEGKSLRAWQGDHAIPEIVGAYVAAGRGLAAAHGAGIVHRDFKADNVLIGSDGRSRVTDFGLAAAQPGEKRSRNPNAGVDAVELTTSGLVLGTPAYMAPEQFAGGNVDPRTDQFNFCASLYEALYRERAFAGTTYDELADNVSAGRVKAPPGGTQVSRGLRAIVVRGLAVKPSDRFPSMDHLLAELGRDRARPWRRLTIVAAALAAALLLGMVADWAVRDRVTAEIRTSFALTGKQLDRTTLRLRDFFRDSSGLALREPALRDLAGHRDQADFGLGSASADREELERLHGTFVSAELPKLGNAQLAIVDYKGRLMYSSYAPGVWDTDMRVLPPIRAALDAGRGRALNVLSYADLAPTKMMGDAASARGLVLVFLQTLALGETPEARAIYLVLEDGKLVLDDLRLDDKTALALVAPDGTATGDKQITQAQIDAARAAGDGVATIGDHEVQARPLLGLDGDKPIATVVMSRQLDGVLTFFPGARIVFALAALLSLGFAGFGNLRRRDALH